MPARLLRIDPALPVGWEDPDTLRVGFERADARFTRPSAGVQRLLVAFRTGLPLAETSRRLRAYGATAAEWRRLVETLAPVLVESPDARTEARPRGRPTLAILGGGRTGGALLEAAQGAGFLALPADVLSDADLRSLSDDALGILVVVERFLQPAPHRRLLLADRMPQLLVRFTDRSLRVGPLAPARGSPCPGCATRHEIDADPALPVLAAQLLGRVPATETSAVAAAASALAVAAIERWVAGCRALSRAQLRIPVTEGLPGLVPELHRVRPHPSCPCAGAVQPDARPHAAALRPASAMKREGARDPRALPAVPESRRTSQARVKAT